MEGKYNVPVLRQWYAFDAGKLQNVNGSGNDLLPLPNTDRFKYVDIIIEDSKITPQILVYSGDLSESQKKQFEDLHERAKDVGGKLFTLNYDEIKDQLRYSKELTELVDPTKKEDFIDLQRLVILYDQDVVFNRIKEKYNLGDDTGWSSLLYADFDRDIWPVLSYASKNCTKIKSQDVFGGAHLPVYIYKLASHGVSFSVENNFIFSMKNNPEYVQNVISRSEKRTTRSSIFDCIKLEAFDCLKKIACDKDKGFVKITHIYSDYLRIDIDTSCKISNDNLEKFVVENLCKLFFVGGAIASEGYKDRTLGKSMPDLIIEDYAKNPERYECITRSNLSDASASSTEGSACPSK